MTTLTPEQLAELERLEAAAMPGEWKYQGRCLNMADQVQHRWRIDSGKREVVSASWHDSSAFYPTEEESRNNGQFIAALRNAAKPLIEMVKRLQEENEQLQREARVDATISDDLIAEMEDLRRQLAERGAEIKKQRYELDALYRQKGA
jgi:hypothetical protein